LWIWIGRAGNHQSAIAIVNRQCNRQSAMQSSIGQSQSTIGNRKIGNRHSATFNPSSAT
jgi:hypothetical protein